MQRLCGWWMLVAFVLTAASVRSVTASPSLPPPVQRNVDFAKDVRVIFAERCITCHGAEKQRGGLRLDRPEDILAGGDSGPAFEPGQSADSLLIHYVAGLDSEHVMPPKGNRLSPTEVAILRAWIDQGARIPEPVYPDLPLLPDDLNYWAFQPVRRPAVPVVRGGNRAVNPIDKLLLAKLEAQGLTLEPIADRRTLIRRATFDLTGLPPTAEAVEAFVNDPAHDAYERLIDRLLASPAYGERWARHWLDLVRYADSDGFNQDAPRPNAWRYRDYVIASLNADKPYDRFLAEQIAGDELDPNDCNALVATAFLRHWPYEWNQAHVRLQWENILNDITDVTGQVALGLTFACARCHDHKYDPILQRDYYRLQAFFAGISPVDEYPLDAAKRTENLETQLARWEEATAELRHQLETIEASARTRHFAERKGRFPKDIQAMLDLPAAKRSPLEQQLADLASRQLRFSGSDLIAKMSKEEQGRWKELQAKLREFEKLRPSAGAVAMVVTDVGSAAPPTAIPGRHDSEQQAIAPGFLLALGREAATIAPTAGGKTTGRRTALARWLTDPSNPLTPRVIVNRLWHQHFGRGLVSNPNDFGRRSGPPSHPELLDWLASELVQRGWRLKEMHRLMMTSAAYRQASAPAHRDRPNHTAADWYTKGKQVDPDNRLYWRMPMRRLHAEEVYDATLATSGALVSRIGGPAVHPPIPKEATLGYSWPATGNVAERNRRAIYIFVKRNLPFPVLDAFDFPDTHESCAERSVTTTAPQALMLINSDWSREHARQFAKRVAAEAGPEPRARIDRAYRLAFGKPPTAEEQSAALRFVTLGALPATASSVGAVQRVGLRQTPASTADAALVEFCQALLNANEFVYVD